MLTPDEFVFAGEALVYRCPTWSWGSGLPDHAVGYLPSDKQFLITKNVPCLARADDLAKHAKNTKNESIKIEGEADEWVGMVTENLSLNQQSKATNISYARVLKIGSDVEVIVCDHK